MKKKKRIDDLDKVKANITLIIAFMIFLFAYCYVMYTKVGSENNLNGILNIDGGTESIAERLEQIIPFSEITDLKYVTAYQDKLITSTEIENDIFLQKAYENSASKYYSNFKETLNRLYGDNLFLINQSFNVNGKIECKYDDQELYYQCQEKKYDGLIYDAIRTVVNLELAEENYNLVENIIFYTYIEEPEAIKYQIYADEKYQNLVGEFTSKDLNNQNISEYIIDNYKKYELKYISKFIINSGTYCWIKTERLN